MAVMMQDGIVSLSDFPDFPVSKGFFIENIKMGYRSYLDPDFVPDMVNLKIVMYMHGSGGSGKMANDHPLVKAVTEAGYLLLSISGLGSAYSSPTPWTYGYGNVQSPMLYGRMVKGFWETQAVTEIVCKNLLGTTVVRDYENGYFSGTNPNLQSPRGSTRTTLWGTLNAPGIAKLRIRVVQGEANRCRIQWRNSSTNVITYQNVGNEALSPENNYQAIVDIPPGTTHFRVYYSNAANSPLSDPILSVALYIPIILLGHSLGALKAFSWSALVKEKYPRSFGLIDHIIGNGGTSAGSGNFRWNSIHRNIAAYSSTYRKVDHSAIAYYSDNDDFCPKDFSDRMKMTLREDQDNLYFISPGALGHSWYAQRPDLVVGHLNQMFNQGIITVDPTDPLSPPAVPGP